MDKTHFDQSCGYCGARFEVVVTDDATHRARYACPECGKTYTATGATGAGVRLLAARTDGKGDTYTETLF